MNSKLLEENAQLRTRMNEIEQYSRLNCVEIHGVPEVRDENVVSTVCAIGRALQFPIDETMIDACHRLRKNPQQPDRPRLIIVKFVSRLQKDNLLRAKKVKRILTTKDLNSTITTSSPIYINESLTSENRKLYQICRDYKKDKNIKFLWVNNGKIKMRKEEGSRVYVVTSAASLNDVH